jgi:hypothetical protein
MTFLTAERNLFLVWQFAWTSHITATGICDTAQLRNSMGLSSIEQAQSSLVEYAFAYTGEQEARELQIGPDVLHHMVRADLLAAAENAGGLTSEIADKTRAELLSLAEDADAVILTCSTLGPAVDGIDAVSSKPILRTDAALATTAAQRGGKIVVLCAVEPGEREA